MRSMTLRPSLERLPAHHVHKHAAVARAAPMNDLSVYIAQLHRVLVHDAQPPNPRSGQVQRCRGPQPTCAHYQHRAAAQPSLCCSSRRRGGGGRVGTTARVEALLSTDWRVSECISP